VKIEIVKSRVECPKFECLIFPTYLAGKNDSLDVGSYDDDFSKLARFSSFKGEKGDELESIVADGKPVILISLGKKSEITERELINCLVKKVLVLKSKYEEIAVDIINFEELYDAKSLIYKISSELMLGAYQFNKYKSKNEKAHLKKVFLVTGKNAKMSNELNKAEVVSDAINLCRDWVNEPPNVFHSEKFAAEVEKDAKKLAKVTVKVLNETQIKKECMGLLLAVNAGSTHAPRVVHLTYNPTGATKKTKHIALVGKGLTFDTGGYSLKPPTSMPGMKGDMAGAATAYAAFKAAVSFKPKIKISCFLGITDNMISGGATTPDAIVTSRSGKTVEILNTDAEGRLVLADVLDYACDFKPDVIIDVATLTGAILVALGDEICGLFSNDDKLAEKLETSAKLAEEYMWRMPIIEEFRKEIISKVADLKNMGENRNGGASKAAAFLEKFIRDGITWAHLDIAGVSESQGHLPYCSSKGASGLMVRTLVEYLINGKV